MKVKHGGGLVTEKWGHGFTMVCRISHEGWG